ncbi:MAG: hypothetical protein JSV77_01590 [Dehalococcoidales bacterium]|nr:MAG: hypothetical protein JSV77_01590 [Dehalococcoidales bacterium]
MNKIAVAVVVVVLLAVYGVLALDYIRQGPEQDRLLSEIEEIDQSMQALEESPSDLLEELAMVQASLAAEQATIPDEINSSDVIEAILSLAQEAGVKAVPFVTDPWTTTTIGEGTYRIFRISIGVEGAFVQVSDFISRLENGEFNTLSVEQLSITVAGDEGEVYTGGGTPVLAELDLVVIAQFLTN